MLMKLVSFSSRQKWAVSSIGSCIFDASRFLVGGLLFSPVRRADVYLEFGVCSHFVCCSHRDDGSVLVVSGTISLRLGHYPGTVEKTALRNT
jgi:hypothetical protein